MSGTDLGVQRLNATLSGDCTRIVNPGQDPFLIACTFIFTARANVRKIQIFHHYQQKLWCLSSFYLGFLLPEIQK